MGDKPRGRRPSLVGYHAGPNNHHHSHHCGAMKHLLGVVAEDVAMIVHAFLFVSLKG